MFSCFKKKENKITSVNVDECCWFFRKRWALPKPNPLQGKLGRLGYKNLRVSLQTYMGRFLSKIGIKFFIWEPSLSSINIHDVLLRKSPWLYISPSRCPLYMVDLEITLPMNFGALTYHLWTGIWFTQVTSSLSSV